MSLQEEILKITKYGEQKELIEHNDRNYVINQYMELYGIDSFEVSEVQSCMIKNQKIELMEVLKNLTDIAVEMGLVTEDSITERDLFDTKLMGILTARPSEIARNFWWHYEGSPEKATEYFYRLCQNTNYIRMDRIRKDRKWKVKSPYGEIDITINLSKPEKDPRAIAAARNDKKHQYPACQLCMENEGYAGRMDHPARQNHRIIPIMLQGKEWGFQYSPYVYYKEHCIVLNGEHVPMKIDRDTFQKLFDFIKLFPHCFLGSNADLPIVGGSILSHDHFQGGNYTFAMAKAEMEEKFVVKGFEEVEAGIVKWPLSVIRLRCKDEKKLVDLGEHILNAWRNYTDEDAFIFAETDGEKHNTITPIARKAGEIYELDLALRNNITTEEHPLGVYHPHAEYHNIKKENIGLIEVMGLAVLPARLEKEMGILADYLVNKKDIKTNEIIAKHAEWAEGFASNYKEINSENVMKILEKEIGNVFVKVLEDAGVFKRTPEGKKAFKKFIEVL